MAASLAILIFVAAASIAGVDGAGVPAAERFERVGPFGGDVRSLLISDADSARVYLGTSDGQIYRSDDGGESWKRIHPGIGRRQFVVDTLVQHPGDPSRIYAGAWDLRSRGGGLFESRDAGASWSAVQLAEGAAAVRDFAICRHKPDYMVAGTLGGAYVSSDGGKHWSRTGGDFRDIESVAINPSNPRILFVGTWRLGYRSTDFGRTWVGVHQGMMFDSDVFSIAIDPRRPQVMYAGACSGIYRSANGASSWSRLRIVPARFTVRTRVVAVDPSDPQRVYGGTTEGLFVSRDDGRTWTRMTRPDVIVNAVQVDPRNNSRILLGTENEGVLASDDAGRTWRAANSGFVHRQVSRIVAEARSDRVFAGLTDGGGGVYQLDRGGRKWDRPAPGMLPAGDLRAYLPLPDGRRCLAGTSRGLYLQAGPGAAWTRLPGVVERLAISDLALDAASGLVFAGTNRGVVRAPLSSLKFEVPPQSRFAPQVASVIVAGTSPRRVYAATTAGVLRSSDGGASWLSCSRGLPDRATIEALAVSPVDERFLLAGTAAGLFESRDGGDTWTKSVDGRLGVDVPSVIFLDAAGKGILAADNTFGGVFLSADAGNSWSRIEADEFSSPVRYLALDPVDPSRVYLGTNSDGVYRLRLDGIFPWTDSH